MPKALTVPVDDQVPPLLLLDPAATYNTTLTAPPLDAVQLTRVVAQLAEWSSRRHTRSPGEAGGGRSDLCHDNDEPDPVNRRRRVGDNFVEPPTELPAGPGSLRELLGTGLPSRHEQLSAGPEQRKS